MKCNHLPLFLLLTLVCQTGAEAAQSPQQAEFLILPAAPRQQVQERSSLARDPFNWGREQQRRLVEEEKAAADPFTDVSLQAILWTPDHPQAMLNKTMVQEGDMVDGIQVVTIARDHIRLRKQKKSHTIYFAKPTVDFGYPTGTTHRKLRQEKADDH